MTQVPIYHGHMFCGLGGGAKGMNEGEAKLGAILQLAKAHLAEIEGPDQLSLG